jgi:hypothetical protein
MDVIWMAYGCSTAAFKGLARKARKTRTELSSARGAPLDITLNFWFGVARPD